MSYPLLKIKVTVIVLFLLAGFSGCMMTPPYSPHTESCQVRAKHVHQIPPPLLHRQQPVSQQLVSQQPVSQQQQQARQQPIQPQQQWTAQKTPQNMPQQNGVPTALWFDPLGLFGSPTPVSAVRKTPAPTNLKDSIDSTDLKDTKNLANLIDSIDLIDLVKTTRKLPPTAKSKPIVQVAYQPPQSQAVSNTIRPIASPELYKPWNLDNYRVPRSVSRPYRLVADTQPVRTAPPAMNPDQLLTPPQPNRNSTATTEKTSLFNLGRDFVNEFRPSNDRKWSQNHAVLQTAELNGNRVTVRNIRYSKYETVERYTTQYYDAVFDLDDIRTIDLVVVPFRGVPRLAHVESSFGFADGRHLGLSIEARYEEGEQYDPIGAGLRQFELIYVFADERDMIRLGTDVNKNDVHVYRLKFEPGEVRKMFVDALQRANKLAEKPEFYHPLTNSCVTNLIVHINKGRPKAIPKEYRTLLPGLMDHYVYDLKLIETTAKTFQETKENAKVNWLVEKFGDLEYFSAGIRQNMY